MKRSLIRTILTVLQILISVGLMVWLLRRVPLLDLWGRRTLITPIALLGAFVVYLLSFLLTGFNWWFILRGMGVNSPYRRVIGASFSGLFFSMFLPSSASADVVRGFRLYQNEKQSQKIALSVLIDRLTGVIVFGLTMLILTPFYLEQLPFDLLASVNQFLILGVVGLGGLLGVYMVYRWKPTLFAPYVNAIQRTPPYVFVIAIFITLGVHVLVSVSLLILLLPFWETPDPVFALYVTELLTIATVLPISIAGLGIREALYVTLFGVVSVTTGDAILVSISQLGVVLLTALIGGAVELRAGIIGLRMSRKLNE